MKKISTMIIIGVLCFSMFSIFSLKANRARVRTEGREENE